MRVDEQHIHVRHAVVVADLVQRVPLNRGNCTRLHSKRVASAPDVSNESK
jgi:hypothetical protein